MEEQRSGDDKRSCWQEGGRNIGVNSARKRKERLTCRVCGPGHSISISVTQQIKPDEAAIAKNNGQDVNTHKIAGVARGGGAGRGLATVHHGLDGSRPIERAADFSTVQNVEK